MGRMKKDLVGRMNRMEKDLVGWIKKDLVVRMKRIEDGEGPGGEDEEDGGGPGGEDGGGSRREDGEEPEEEGVVSVKYGAKQTTTTMNYCNYQCTVISGQFLKVATKEYTCS